MLGEVHAPGLQVGLATVSAAVQRAGGTQAHPGPVLDETLEQMAAGIEGGALPEAIVLGTQARSKSVSMRFWMSR